MDAEEPTTRSTVALADMLEPPSETSLSLQLDQPLSEVVGGRSESSGVLVEPASGIETDQFPAATAARRSSGRLGWAALGVLALLGILAFALVATGVLEGPPADRGAGAGSVAPSPSVPSAGEGPASLGSPESAVPESAVPEAAVPEAAVPELVPEAAVPELVPEAAVPDGVMVHSDDEEVAAEVTAPPAAVEPEPVDAEPVTHRAARGSVNIAARGGWADIFVDGQPSGRTPRSLSLSPGRHSVELRRDGTALVRRAVTVRSGRLHRLVFDL